MAAALIAAEVYYRSQKAKPLTDKDTIVLTDFDNKTGDAVFDDVLKLQTHAPARQARRFHTI